MNNEILNLETTNSAANNLIHRPLLWRGFVFIALTLASSFAFLPAARAACEEGCDSAHFSAFLGDAALSSNTTGSANTAIGYHSLQFNTTGQLNTGTGYFT